MDRGPSYPREGQHKMERFAVYLQSNGSVRTGIVLEGLNNKNLLDENKGSEGGMSIEPDTILVKTAIFSFSQDRS